MVETVNPVEFIFILFEKKKHSDDLCFNSLSVHKRTRCIPASLASNIPLKQIPYLIIIGVTIQWVGF